MSITARPSTRACTRRGCGSMYTTRAGIEVENQPARSGPRGPLAAVRLTTPCSGRLGRGRRDPAPWCRRRTEPHRSGPGPGGSGPAASCRASAARVPDAGPSILNSTSMSGALPWAGRDRDVRSPSRNRRSLDGPTRREERERPLGVHASRGRTFGPMLPQPDEDQEFFRETTARFLDEQAPVDELRAPASTIPTGSTATTGAGAPSWAGRRCSSPRRTAAAAISGDGAGRPDARRPRVRPPRRARPARSPTNVVAAALSDADGDATPTSLAGLARRRRRSRPGATASRARTTGSATVGLDRPRRRRRRRARRREAAGRGGRRGRPPAGHRTHRRPGSPRSSCPRDAAGVTIEPMRTRRPHPPLLRGRASTRCGCRPTRVVGELGRRRRPGRAPAAARPRHRQRRVRRRDAGRLRHDRRVGVRPLLLRPAAGVVPGAQAPLRRHEDLARGQPRDQRRRRRGRGRRQRRRRPSW